MALFGLAGFMYVNVSFQAVLPVPLQLGVRDDVTQERDEGGYLGGEGPARVFGQCQWNHSDIYDQKAADQQFLSFKKN